MQAEALNPFQALIDQGKPQPKRTQSGRVYELGTRAEVARKLLALGPLEWHDFIAITGWEQETAASALGKLRLSGVADRTPMGWSLV